MAAYVSVLRVPKAGSTDDECEDAAAVIPEPELDEWLREPLFAAVADGASESLLARDWANLLANAVLRQAVQDSGTLRGRDRFAGVLVDAGKQWNAWVMDYVTQREARGQPIAWYERPKLNRGAYSTLLSAHFDWGPSQSANWHAAAMGDSCLFQVRNEQLIHAFPVESSADFANTPALVNSNNSDRALLAAHIQLTSGIAEQGDQFFLCTDALAAWFLEEVENFSRPWVELRNFTCVGDRGGLADWLRDLRAHRRIRNDDVAVVHVDLG